MNIHEQICDARRLKLRKELAELAKWCGEKSGQSHIDTEKTLDALEEKTAAIRKEVDAECRDSR